MDGLCTWLTKYHPPFECDGGKGTTDTTEAREAKTSPTVAIESNNHTDDELETWLATGHNLPPADPVTRIRVIWLPLENRASASSRERDLYPWRVVVKEEHLDRMLTTFRIALAYKYSFTAPQGFASLQEGVGTNDRSTSHCIFRRNSFAVAWAQSAPGSASQAVIVCHSDTIPVLLEVIHHQRAHTSHPLFFALLVAVWNGNYIGRFLISLTNDITQVENKTGYHPWSIEIYGTADGDFSSLSAKMSGVSTNLAELTATTKFLRGLLKWIADLENKKKKSQQNDDFMACVEMLGARLDQQELHLSFLRDRANNQLTVLFNLITSQDARTGIEVARDSKSLAVASKLDSSSMKTLAAVTVVFLPGTFVASFFAMPLFDFQDNSMAVSSKFWIYWVVTVPLTALTIAVWYLWIRRKRFLMEQANQPRRDSESGLKTQ